MVKPRVWILDDEGLAHDKEIEIYKQHQIEYKITMSEGKVIPTDIVELYNQTINNFSSYQH